MISILISVFFVHIFAAMSPGPAVLLCARVGLTQGMHKGAGIAFGIGIGACFWAASAMFGMASLFKIAPGLLLGLKILGGGYLVWMAWHIWRDAPAPLSVSGTGPKLQTQFSAIWLGLRTQLANPKPAIFFAAAFVGLIPADTPVWVYATALVIVFLNEFFWNLFVARLFSFETTRAGYMKLKSPIDRLLAGCLGALGVKIAAT